MAVIGEEINGFVKQEIDWRQKEQYKGIGTNRGASNIQYLNNQHAWVKMASSVYIGGVGTEEEIKKGDLFATQRLNSIGLNPPSFKGNLLAKKFILFNGVSEVSKPNKRAGVTQNKELWNPSSAYGLGGTEYGLQPIPGIEGIDVECLNRGSIRRATITLKAYNKFQFEVIEMLYLRVGYHIMLEFGNDKYYNHTDKIYEDTGNTLIEKVWFGSSNTTQLGMLKQIKEEQKRYSGNYEGFFGRVTNFSWDVTPEGSYDISIELHTVGDVIESLQVNLPIPFLTDTSLIQSGSDSSVDSSVQNVVDAILYNAEADKCDEESIRDYVTINAIITEKDKKLSESDPDKYKHLLNTKESYSRFLSFGTLLESVNNFCIPLITPKDGNPSQVVEINTQFQPMGYYNFQTPLDPRVCIFKVPQPSGTIMEGFTFDFNPLLNDFITIDKKIIVGNIMNLYLNFAFVKKCLRQNVDKKGKLSLFKFLSNLCDGINSSLGGVNNLEPVIIDDYLVNIIDQNPIPGIIESSPNSPSNFRTFGYDFSNKAASFIKDINLNTSITPEFATMITIGATAQGSKVKGIDATYFSKWNAGLTDRFNIDAQTPELTKDQLKEIEKQQKTQEYTSEFKRRAEASVKKGQTQRDIEVSSQYSTASLPDSLKPHTPTLASLKIQGDKELPNGVYNLEEFVQSKWSLYTAKKYIQLAVNDKPNPKTIFKSNYFYYLSKAFGTTESLVIDNGVEIPPNPTPKYFEFDNPFIIKAKPSYAEYLREITKKLEKQAKDAAEEIGDLFSSNQLGFIPFNLGIRMSGISGLKIYNKINVDQSFLPPNYPSTLHFITTKVNHYVKDNSWETQLETIVLPKTTKYPINTFEFKFEDYGPHNLLPEEDRGPKAYQTNPPSKEDFVFIENRNDKTQYLSKPGRYLDGNYGDLGDELTMDAVLKDIHPDIRQRFRGFFSELKENYPGYKAYINSMYRTPGKSTQLSQNSDTAVAKAGKSRHTYGAAVDFNIVTPKGKWLRMQNMEALWKNTNIPEVAKKYGLWWGGIFKPRVKKEDGVHFYFPTDKELINNNVKKVIELVDGINDLTDIHPFDIPLLRKLSDDEVFKIFKKGNIDSHGNSYKGEKYQYPQDEKGNHKKYP